MSKRLFEAMIEANHRAVAGDTQAGLHPEEYPDELPLIALTCVDPRLNALLPQALGVPAEQFIWLRNAGNIITGPLSSTMRSLALACAVKGGKEIVIIGHTDCQVGKTSAMQLLERFRALGIERHLLPDNLNEFFGMFGSDRQNVMKAVDHVRTSPLIGPRIPVQGLLIDIETGRLEWLVNGYETLGATGSRPENSAQPQPSPGLLTPLADFKLGELRFPDAKIGDVVSTLEKEVLQTVEQRIAASFAPGTAGAAAPAPPAGFQIGPIRVGVPGQGETVSTIAQELVQKLGKALETGAAQGGKPPLNAPPRIPLPPPIRPKMHLRRNPK
ncbi:MAG TPA: carbonic anhydrase [Verrucomicrobiae bacterium]|nr:carbonic anhydrase [Verrucomicrobiae bacterium]